jgi:VWFA-related protein
MLDGHLHGVRKYISFVETKRLQRMTRASFLCFLAAAFCATGVTAGQSAEAGSAATLRVDTNLVVVDITVTDAHQNPIHNLTAADFNLREDGHAQTIRTFEEHTANEAVPPSQPLPSPKLEPGEFTNVSPTSATGSLNIVLLDKLNTPMEDQAYSLDQLSQYLKSAPAGTRIAVVSLTSSQLFLIQGFTSDPELLRAALSSKKAAMSASLFLDNPVSGGARTTVGEGMKTKFRRELTLNALNELGHYLGGFSGRKNLIWFSASFPVSFASIGRESWANSPDLDHEFKEMVNLLAHNQVAVYPIDARGLVGNPWFDASNSGGRNVVANIQDLSNSIQRTATNAASQKWHMTDIADPTGGQAFVNTNDLKGAVSQVINAGSNYYTLTYSPTNRKWNDQYRKIQIQLDRDGLALSYRRGYYATDPNASARHTNQKSGSAEPATYSAMRTLMVRGAPEPTEIRFESSVRPAIADTEPSLAAGNQGSPNVKGPYRLYSVHYIADQRDIECPSGPGGENVCTLQFVACVYDAEGRLINTQLNQIRTTITASYYAAFRQSGLHPGFQYQQEISVPVKGEYYLRLGIHDLTTNRVGALELPVSLVSTLPPISAIGAVPATGTAAH